MVISYSEISSYLLNARDNNYNIVDSLLINTRIGSTLEYILFMREFELYCVMSTHTLLLSSFLQTNKTWDIYLSSRAENVIDKWLLDISLGSPKLKEMCSMLGIVNDEDINYVINTRHRIASYYKERRDECCFSLRTIKRTDVRRYYMHMRDRGYYTRKR